MTSPPSMPLNIGRLLRNRRNELKLAVSDYLAGNRTDDQEGELNRYWMAVVTGALRTHQRLAAGVLVLRITAAPAHPPAPFAVTPLRIFHTFGGIAPPLLATDVIYGKSLGTLLPRLAPRKGDSLLIVTYGQCLSKPMGLCPSALTMMTAGYPTTMPASRKASICPSWATEIGSGSMSTSSFS